MPKGTHVLHGDENVSPMTTIIWGGKGGGVKESDKERFLVFTIRIKEQISLFFGNL